MKGEQEGEIVNSNLEFNGLSELISLSLSLRLSLSVSHCISAAGSLPLHEASVQSGGGVPGCGAGPAGWRLEPRC